MKIIKNLCFILFFTLLISLNSVSATKPSQNLTCISINQNISSGASGNEVKKLQRFLFEKGYLAAMPKVNKFGPSIVTAVKKFQVENNLIVTGNIGKVSRNKIKELSCGNSANKTTVINLNDNNLATSSGPNVKFNGVIKIDDKMTFTQDQLTKFKADLIVIRLKYIDKNTDIEPFKTEIGKEVESVFFKNLGIDKVLTKNMGILFYPEIANILGQIKKEYPDQSKAMVAPATSNSSVILSDINPSVVPISQLDKYLKTPLTFKVSNDNLVKEICRTEYLLGSNGADTFDPHWYCNGYYSPSIGVYSNVNFFSNFKSGISGTYETRDGKNYFENEGIYKEVIDFYVKDKSGAESNHVRFTFTR